jgi:hypothetical protein
LDCQLSAAQRQEAPPLVAFVVHRGDVEGRTHDRCREGEATVLLERLPERRQLLVLAVGVDGDAFDQAVEIISHAVAGYAVNRRQWAFSGSNLGAAACAFPWCLGYSDVRKRCLVTDVGDDRTARQEMAGKFG